MEEKNKAASHQKKVNISSMQLAHYNAEKHIQKTKHITTYM